MSERPKLRRLRAGFRGHLEEREVRLVVDADDFGRQLAAVGEVGGDLVGVRDDVVVGDDQAGWVDDEAGAERLHRCGPEFALGRVVEEVLEELVVGLVGCGMSGGGSASGARDRHALRGRDVDDRIEQALREVGEGERLSRRGRSAGPARRPPAGPAWPFGGSSTTGFSVSAVRRRQDRRRHVVLLRRRLRRRLLGLSLHGRLLRLRRRRRLRTRRREEPRTRSTAPVRCRRPSCAHRSKIHCSLSAAASS